MTHGQNVPRDTEAGDHAAADATGAGTRTRPRLALFEPDNPENTGRIIRLATCFGVPVDVIEPCGFPFSPRALKRGALDYFETAEVTIHADWTAFQARRRGRLILLTTAGSTPHHRFGYRPDDILLLGRESAGVPETVHDAADARIRIPMRAGARALNVGMAAAIVLGEALRQADAFDESRTSPYEP